MSDLHAAANQKLTDTTLLEAPSAPSWPERDDRGRFVPGNLAAMNDALSETELPPEFEHLEAEVRDFVAGSLMMRVTTRASPFKVNVYSWCPVPVLVLENCG
jgi:hypothetical protein